MLKIYTVQISVARKLNLTEDPRYLDITVKSGNRAFAPTWKMVMGYKEGRISEEEYTNQYYQLMRESYLKNRKRWDEILSLDEIILACYCQAGSFCHRYLLKDILTDYGQSGLHNATDYKPITSWNGICLAAKYFINITKYHFNS